MAAHIRDSFRKRCADQMDDALGPSVQCNQVTGRDVIRDQHVPAARDQIGIPPLHLYTQDRLQNCTETEKIFSPPNPLLQRSEIDENSSFKAQKYFDVLSRRALFVATRDRVGSENASNPATMRRRQARAGTGYAGIVVCQPRLVEQKQSYPQGDPKSCDEHACSILSKLSKRASLEQVSFSRRKLTDRLGSRGGRVVGSAARV